MDSESAKLERSLVSVVVVALTHLDGNIHLRNPKPSIFRRNWRCRGIANQHGRDSTLSVLENLHRQGFTITPFLLRRWAVEQKWRESDAQLLDEYAQGVLAGIRYHHANRYG